MQSLNPASVHSHVAGSKVPCWFACLIKNTQLMNNIRPISKPAPCGCGLCIVVWGDVLKVTTKVCSPEFNELHIASVTETHRTEKNQSN